MNANIMEKYTFCFEIWISFIFFVFFIVNHHVCVEFPELSFFKIKIDRKPVGGWGVTFHHQKWKIPQNFKNPKFWFLMIFEETLVSWVLVVFSCVTSGERDVDLRSSVNTQRGGGGGGGGRGGGHIPSPKMKKSPKISIFKKFDFWWFSKKRRFHEY